MCEESVDEFFFFFFFGGGGGSERIGVGGWVVGLG